VSGGDLLVDRRITTQSLTRSLTIGGARNTSGSAFAQLNFQNIDNDGNNTDYTGARIESQNPDAADDGDLRFATYNGTLTTRMIITPDGNIGIGINTPNNNLTIKQDGLTANSGLRLISSASSNNWTIFYDTNGYLSFAKNGSCVTRMDNTGAFVACSDIRLKQDIENLSGTLEAIMQLRPVSYTFRDSERQTGRPNFGFIAQEVKAVYPELVENCSGEYLGVNYQAFSVLAIKAVQEQQLVIESQQTEIQRLQNLEDRLIALEQLLVTTDR